MQFDTENFRRAVEILRPIVKIIKSDKERQQSSKRLIDRFQPILHPQNLDYLTKEEFYPFTLHKENEHWSHIQRHNGKVLNDLTKLKRVLGVLLDESRPVEERIDEIEPKGGKKPIPGFGRSLYTPILMTVYPDNYCVFNTKTSKGLNKLGLYDLKGADSSGARYKRVLEICTELKCRLDCTFFDLDLAWHKILVEKSEKQKPRIFKHSPGDKANDWESHQRPESVVAIGWMACGDLEEYETLREAAEVSVSQGQGKKVSHVEKQYRLLYEELGIGDVVLYYGHTKILGVGIVENDEYIFDPSQEYGHCRKVRLVEPFMEVSVSDDKILSDFFYRNTTLVEIEDEDFQTYLAKFLNKSNPDHDWYALFSVKKAGLTKPKDLERRFLGYQPETFNLLKKFHKDPVKQTYTDIGDDWKTYLREPSKDLFHDLAVTLTPLFGDGLETKKNILSRILKNDFGRGRIHTNYWGAFYPKGAYRLESPQLFVYLNHEGIRAGFGFGSYTQAGWKKNLEKMRRDSVLPENYFEWLSNQGVQLTARDNADKWTVLSDDFDIDKCIEEVSESKMSLNLEIRLSAEQVMELGANLFEEISRVFVATSPMMAFFTSKTPESLISRWMNHFDIHNLDDLQSSDLDSDGEGEQYTWEEFLSFMKWQDSFSEAQLLRSLFPEGVSPRSKQLVFYGPPGTGKTRAALDFAKVIAGSTSRVKRVQFHQSYSYEHFMEGIKPSVDKEGKMSYADEFGAFVNFCIDAGKQPKKNFVFIIDEINRGNTSRIFGELMLLLEYRDEEMELLYSKTLFSIPENVFVFGTMNSADRSIALVDYALRRRFRFVEVKPRAEVISAWYGESRAGLVEQKTVLEFFKLVNSQISDRRLAVGHSYLLDERQKSQGLTKEYLKSVWDTAIYPLLEEYYAGMAHKLAAFDFKTLWDNVSRPNPNDEPVVIPNESEKRAS